MFAGLFESHITIDALDSTSLQRFQETCQALGVKCILIKLPRGITQTQPMANLVHVGHLPQARREVFAFAETLRREGFRVVRIKIEAAPHNEDIPLTDEQAQGHSPSRYFEYHAKLVLEAEAPLDDLLAACEPHKAHLSINAFKQREDGQLERFVTLRCQGVGKQSADSRLSALLQSLEVSGFPPVKVVSEYCVFDSNLSLDNGWLSE